MAMLPVENPESDVSGALIMHEGYVPSESDGPLVYLNGGDDLGHVLGRVESAGRKSRNAQTSNLS